MKRFLALALSLSMMLGMTACGGDTGSSTASTSGSGTSASTSTTQTTGGSDSFQIVLATNDGSTTDDRVPTPWMNHNLATNLMFRTLLLADASLTETSPDLAESVEVSDDGLTYTITLKEGLKWSDGEDLTVDDVVWSIETVMTAIRRNSIYSAAFGMIDSMTTEGNVITMTLSSPYSEMKNILAQFSILPKHCLEGESGETIDTCSYWTAPVTSGYYMVGEFNVGNYFTLVPNPYYEGTAPQIEKVTVSFVNDFLTAAQAGSADFLYGNATDLVEGMAALDNYTSFPVDVLFYKYFIFNMRGIDGNENEAMQPLAVRQALVEAIDRAALSALYPNASILNSGVPNSDPAYNGFEYTFDAEKAKADLAASGYDMSRPLRICYYNNDQTSIDLINAIAYYLEQTGLTVETTLSNDGTTDLFTTRDYDIGFKGLSSFSMGEWYAEYASNSATFANIFGGDTTFDAAIAAFNAATTTEARNEALQTLQTLEQENLYKWPLFTIGNYVYVNNRVTLPDGVEFCNPLFINDIDFENWTIG